MRCHPEAGEARRGTSRLQFALSRNITDALTQHVCRFAKAIERWRGPSARFASLGMTSLAFQPLQQLPMNPIKPAIAKDHHHVFRFQQRHELLYNMSGVRFVKRRTA